MPKPLAKFKVWPEVGGLYFTVIVHPNLKELRKATHTKNAMGVCDSFMRISYEDAGKSGRLMAELGEIHIAKPFFGTNVIAHECLHGVLHWAERKKILKKQPLNQRREEMLAYALGHMCHRIYSKLYKLKIIG